ncbi:FAD-binding oxidoreductase [Calidifontibacter sp. DB0510]|uniref:FAD-binding oxidoreductase n=1 Tax=Metallococcus carri TaxID=1656884 RepID=A0A967AY52_9MICO|nr:FAD-binding oxidoreductase [Metallococcus carri]NOP36223.1 FAD-binding oxidoreductase [Calidifontibacter sp. DB2511S]
MTLEEVGRSVWWGWGDPARAGSVPATALRRLRDELSLSEVHRPPVALADLSLPAPRWTPATRDAVTALLGADHVLTDPRARMEHAGGKSYLDLLRARTGETAYAPDAVLLPADGEQIAGVLALAAEHGFTVIPYGGGTSVVGGLTASDPRPHLSLDLRRLAGLVALDEVSGTATFGAGTRAIDAERALRERGWTLGHYPQSYQQASIGGFVATRSAGQSSSGYGRIDDMVLAARAVTPAGEVAFGERSPATAAGPRLLDLVVGNEGACAVITQATLRVHRAPSATRHAAYAFPSFEAAAAALREMVQTLGHDGQPDVTRVSDADETRVSLMLAGRAGRVLGSYLRGRRMPDASLMILLWHDSSDAAAAARAKRATPILRAHGAVALPARIARGWEHGRFRAPYLRDELMTRGVFVETLETATTWSNLPRLYAVVRQAISTALASLDTSGIVQCHISHVYHSGASLYFTYLAREADDPAEQWRAVKAAASSAIVAAEGTITHHHAVGRDHRDYLEEEIGEVGARILRAVKAELDPHDVLNPGVLIPPVS